MRSPKRTPIDDLHALGQSLWYDNIQRRLLEDGTIAAMIARGEVRGMTSNPSIFNAAIARSQDYDSALKPMAWSGYSAEQILDRLIMEDIRTAADLFLPLYRTSGGGDGYVSVEVRPDLARDTEGTISEAQRLWGLVDRPNVMIKIPATREGIPAIRRTIANGINVNVTLIFSLARYLEVMEAYLDGLEDRLNAGQPIHSIASVASFFVSRLDTKADQRLDQMISQEGPQAESAAGLRGALAIASAKLAYAQFRQVFGGERFIRLKANGARVQRPLWASTSTKNPAYPDTMYVDELIGPDTVNTMPPQTVDAFRDHGKARLTVEKGLEQAHQVFSKLQEVGVSVDDVTRELEEEGVKAFADAFEALMKTVETRRIAALSELGPLAGGVARRIAKLDADSVPSRLRAVDPSLWSDTPAGRSEVRKRMGWVTSPDKSRKLLPDLRFFTEQVRTAGYTHALLLGMGGSSLAPEVMRLVFGLQPGGLDLAILDSTDPAQVIAAAHRAPVEKTLYIVSSKSGGTAEVNAFLDYFWQRAQEAVGNHASEHFIAITDPDTSLEKLAQERNFRQIFLGDPKVGGRYSALTAFGLAPAALMGLELNRLLDRAAWLARQTTPDIPAGRNPGAVLGAILGEATLQGRDKLTFISDPEVAPFGSWLEQLVAESSGKQGKGIVPVDGEPPAGPEEYGDDRLFIRLRYSHGSHTEELDQVAIRLLQAGHPTLSFTLEDPYDIGVEFYRWEMAVAIACAILGVNAFDQPDVQDAKQRTLAKIEAYHQQGQLDEILWLWEGQGVTIFGTTLPKGVTGQPEDGLSEILIAFLAQGRPGEYVAVNAYLPRNEHFTDLLTRLRLAIRQRTRLATTVGFGPRFLHSTGQLHKGGPNTGLFLEITADPVQDVEIPGQGLTFGTLERAQALGDLEVLLARGRRALRIHLRQPEEVERLVKALAL